MYRRSQPLHSVPPGSRGAETTGPILDLTQLFSSRLDPPTTLFHPTRNPHDRCQHCLHFPAIPPARQATADRTGRHGAGGSGTCGVKIAGSVTTAGFTVPVSFDFCNTGLQAVSCDAGNSALNQSVAGQGGLGGAVRPT